VRLVGDARQALLADAEDLQELRVPPGRREVDEAGSRRNREARCGLDAEELRIEVVAEGDEARGPAEDLRLGLGEPGELRRPEGGVQRRPRPGVDGGRVGHPPAEPLRRAGRAGVAPPEHRRERPARLVERDEAVPEARGADRVDVLVPPADDLPDEPDDLVGVTTVVAFLLQIVQRVGALAEALGAHRGRADVEGEHRRHRSNLLWSNRGSRHRLQSP